MDRQEGVRTCGRCHKEVAEANFALHETHCSRFLCLCPECDEAVPKGQLQEHREEQHTLVRCSRCNKKIERCCLQDHESDACLERLQKCPFCELEVPWKGLDEHTVVCGSRTELCRDCSRYVKLTDWTEHRLICSISDKSSRPPPAISNATSEVTTSCTGCAATFSAEEIDKHKMEGFHAAKWGCENVGAEEEAREDGSDSSGQEAGLQLGSAATVTHTFSQRAPTNDGELNVISTCPHCHLALPVFILRWHKAKCQIHIVLKNNEVS